MRRRFRGRIALALALPFLMLAVAGCNYIAGIHLYSIPSKSMQPTIYEGDKIVVDQRYYVTHVVQDGDVVAFHHGEYLIVKRVMAVSGESIEGKDGMVLRGGQKLKESYITPLTDSDPPEFGTFALRKIPPNEIFVLGDNRGASLDSRAAEFGPVHVSDVVGKVLSVYDSSHPTAGRAL